MPTLFTSDTHFGDPRVLRLDRPYGSLAEHDDDLIARWNAAVAPDDVVWHLGDFALGRPPTRPQALLDRLNGTKHLMVGNNDGPATLQAPGWASVQHYAELDIDGRRLVLCHYPFRTWNHMGRGVLDLHGHSHGKLTAMPRQYDVGVDVFDFRPVDLATILASRGRRRGGEAKPRRLRSGETEPDESL
jgi:calcineurin-like phosphoesterase family protein